MTELEKARLAINDADKKMAKLFEIRMNAVKSVAKYKMERGIPVLDESREAEVIKRNSELIDDEVLKEYYINFLQSNMKISREFQHRLIKGVRVAYSGVRGAFANIAAEKIFDGGVAVAYPDFKSAYQAVVSGDCDNAVLPVENSYNGDVGQVMDLTFFGSLYINGVYDISVVQNLAVKKDAEIGDIKKVISHPQALGQCAEYISSKGFSAIECENTAVAAKKVADGNDKTIAAICSVDAAEKYGLKVIDKNINESSNNTTRFAVFSRTMGSSEKSDANFIMVFTVKNEAGSLGKAISIIGNNGFNLRALKSRPTKELIWSYYFYVEGEGNINSPSGKKMIEELGEICSNLKIVGSYSKEITLK